jgi:hypothetical protein
MHEGSRVETSVRTVRDTTETADVSATRRRDPLRTWAGRGTGVVCNGCGEPIQAHEVEYEVELPPGGDAPALNFHLVCYRNWTDGSSR